MRSVFSFAVLAPALMIVAPQTVFADGRGMNVGPVAEVNSVEGGDILEPAYGVPTATRLAMLVPRLRSYRNGGWWLPAGSIAMMVAGTGGVVAGLAIDEDFPREWVVAPSAILALTGATALASSEGLAPQVLAIGAMTAVGVGGLTVFSSKRSSLGGLPSSLGMLSTAALLTVGALIRVPVSRRTVAADYERIATAELREKISEREARAIERNFELSPPQSPCTSPSYRSMLAWL